MQLTLNENAAVLFKICDLKKPLFTKRGTQKFQQNVVNPQKNDGRNQMDNTIQKIGKENAMNVLMCKERFNVH